MNAIKSPHHHGNLREALILAGLELLESGGPDALTLRKCAAHAGVSHAAPAHHFNGLISLKGAIIARGHVMFSETMQAASTVAEPSPQAQLNAICEGYLTFARTHSALFKFMFQPHGKPFDAIDAVTMAELEVSSSTSYGILRNACGPFESESGDRRGIETMIWSLVHGYAMLFGDSNSASPPGQSTPEFSKILPKLRLKSDIGS